MPGDGLVDRIGVGLREVPLREGIAGFNLRQDQREEASAAEIAGWGVGIGKLPVGVVKVLGSQTDLLQMILALRRAGRFSGRLDSRQKQGDQHTNDGDDDEQFDQREADSATS